MFCDTCCPYSKKIKFEKETTWIEKFFMYKKWNWRNIVSPVNSGMYLSLHFLTECLSLKTNLAIRRAIWINFLKKIQSCLFLLASSIISLPMHFAKQNIFHCSMVLLYLDFFPLETRSYLWRQWKIIIENFLNF